MKKGKPSRDTRLRSASRGYVNFSSSGIKVDLARYLRSDAGKALLESVDRASKEFVKKAS